MTDKQKKTLSRILVTFVIFAVLFILEHTGRLENVNMWILFIIYLIPYLIIGYDIILKAAKNLSHGQVFDENFLMMVATIGAFGVREFSEAVAVMLFYQVGELFQSYAVGKSRQSIAAMMDICPEYANIESEGKLVQVDPDDVEVGTIIVIKPGERIPLDGVVVEGESLIDTAALTGESVPRKAAVGDEIISGCVNGSGTLKVRTTKEFDDSTVAKILELVENANSKKAKVENFITKFAKYYTPGRYHRCCDPGSSSSADPWRRLGRVDPASLHFPGNFLPLCPCDLRSDGLLRRNRSRIQSRRSGKGQQLSGSCG